MRGYIYYYIYIPISFAIKTRTGLYETYSQVWELNNIHLGKYRHRYDHNYKPINKKGK